MIDMILDERTIAKATGDESDGATERSRDEVFEVLAHRRRRYALRALRTAGGMLALADLAMEVARAEAEEEGTSYSSDRARRIRITLYHNHVPKMADADIVEFDEERNVVRLHGDLLA